MKTKLIVAAVVALGTSLSGCVVAPAYDGPGYYGPPAVVVAQPVYRGYYGGYYGRGGYYRGPYRRW